MQKDDSSGILLPCLHPESLSWQQFHLPFQQQKINWFSREDFGFEPVEKCSRSINIQDQVPNQQVTNQQVTDRQVTENLEPDSKSNVVRNYVLIFGSFFVFYLMATPDAISEVKSLVVNDSVNGWDSKNERDSVNGKDSVNGMDLVNDRYSVNGIDSLIVIKLWKLDIFIPYITFIIAIIATTIVSILGSYLSRSHIIGHFFWRTLLSFLLCYILISFAASFLPFNVTTAFSCATPHSLNPFIKTFSILLLLNFVSQNFTNFLILIYSIFNDSIG